MSQPYTWPPLRKVGVPGPLTPDLPGSLPLLHPLTPCPTVHKKYTHNVCVNVNRLNCRTRSACDVQNHTVRSHCRNKRRHVNYLYMICNCMNIGPTHCQDTELGSISGGDPGGPGGQRTPTFLSRIRLWPPSFDAMLMSLFSLLYTGYGRRQLSLIKFCFDLGPP